MPKNKQIQKPVIQPGILVAGDLAAGTNEQDFYKIF